jgi:hypothetical protein
MKKVIFNSFTHLFSYLLTCLLDFSIVGDTPLLYCEQPDILLLLVQSGANLSDVNVNGEGLIDKGNYFSFTH